MTTTTSRRRTWRTGDIVEFTATYEAQCDGESETYLVQGLEKDEKFPPCRGGREKAATFRIHYP